MKKDDKIQEQKIFSRVEKREIVEEMKEAYLSYAMSVIVARALPDVRDGLKPVHRRILFAMHEIGLNASAKFRKSAAIVGECFVKDTQILTNKGLFPIQEVKIGDLVYTQCGLQKVKRIFCMPEKPLLKVVLKNGLEVTVTSSQKLKIFNGFEYKWKEAKDIEEYDNIVVKADYPFIQNYAELNFFQSKKFLNENIAYTLGFFMSDGWISSYENSKGKRMGFYSNNQEIIERLVGVFEKEFDYKPNIEVKNYILKKKNGEVARNTGYQIRINRKIINDFFIQNFNLNNIYAITKNIPKQIFISSQSVIFAFISGLIDGDGSIRDEESRIHYGSISEKLINQLLILLQHFDVFSTKYKQKKHANSIVNGKKIKNKYPFYYLEICGIEAKKLSLLLNLASCKKSERVKKIISYSENRLWSHYNIIPDASKVIFKELSDTHLGGGWYKDGEGEKFRMGITYQGGSKLRYSSDLYDKNLSINQVIDFGILAKLRKINSPLEAELNKIIDNKIRFIPVEKIISANSEETYDLEVENDHEFIANGIVSHNCLAKYHPHGDVAVYDSMARMAQDFSLRYPLVHGQGNWGSIDGDSPAAMRYTEAKMSRIAEETLRDIEKETVDFMPNYDSTVKEPKVLPSAIPQLLLNGTFGIAVGMASNIPPHNLNEVVDASIFLIDKPNAGMEELFKIIKGPDFPTGGLIYNTKDIHEAYATGRGGIVCRGEVEITEDEKGKGQIVISSIPYGVNKSDLILKIAELVTEKKIEGVRDVRDESSKEGLQVAIDLKSDSQPQKILNSLYKHTDLEKMFHFNMVALVDGIQPQTLSLKSILEYFIKHREIVVERRVRFDLRKAEERAHILLGLKKALDHIDAIIKTIKSSPDKEAAHKNLMGKFDLSDRQAAAILEMKLQTLAGLERQKIEDELAEKQKLIHSLKSLLQDHKKILEVIKDDLLKIKEKYGDERRTKIIARAATSISYEDTILEVPTILALTQGGYVKRLDPQVYRTQKRGGKGIIGLTTKEEDAVDVFLTAGTHDNALFFSNKGKVYKIKIYEIPEGNRISKGKSILNFLSLSSDEKITSVLAVPKKAEHQYIMMVTKKGVVKKIGAENFEDVRKSGIVAIKLQKDDFLGWANLVSQGDHLIFTTMLGQALRFKESDVREMGRQAGGVTGMRFKKGDELIDVNAINSKEKEADLFVMSEKGFGKKTNVRSYRLQRRGGKGIKTAKVTAKTGKLVAAKIIYPEYEGAAAMSKKGQVIKISMAQVPSTGRQTQGVRIMRLDEGDTIASIICF